VYSFNNMNLAIKVKKTEIVEFIAGPILEIHIV